MAHVCHVGVIRNIRDLRLQIVLVATINAASRKADLIQADSSSYCSSLFFLSIFDASFDLYKLDPVVGVGSAAEFQVQNHPGCGHSVIRNKSKRLIYDHARRIPASVFIFS